MLLRRKWWRTRRPCSRGRVVLGGSLRSPASRPSHSFMPTGRRKHRLFQVSPDPVLLYVSVCFCVTSHGLSSQSVLSLPLPRLYPIFLLPCAASYKMKVLSRQTLPTPSISAHLNLLLNSPGWPSSTKPLRCISHMLCTCSSSLAFNLDLLLSPGCHDGNLLLIVCGCPSVPTG